MEYEIKYNNMKERRDKVSEAEGKGHQMLHDNFDSEWKHGDEPSGTMIFTDTPNLSPIPEPVDLIAEFKADYYNLKAELKAKGVIDL